LYDKYNFTSDNIYNVDETGISIYPVSRLKCLDSGKRMLEAYLQERSVLVTVEIFMSASGNFMPTMFVLPRARENRVA
jgi:hypothetical protein